MIVDCVADLHGYCPKLEGGDLLIVAGDLTRRDTEGEHFDFSEWVDIQPYKKKIVISGNHDNHVNPLYIDSSRRCQYLCDSVTEFEGLKIWGSPWTKTFEGMNPRCKAFTVDLEEDLAETFDLIPDDVDILITHSPPYLVLDKTERGESVGSKALLGTLNARIKPKLHVFGHIHECGGKRMILRRPGYGSENNTICVNASHVNERYDPVNPPMRIIL